MKPIVGPPPAYPPDARTTKEPNLSGRVREVRLPEDLMRQFAEEGAEMVEGWEHILDGSTAICILLAGEPVSKRGKRYHASVSIKDRAGWYCRWPTYEEACMVLNTFFVTNMAFTVEIEERFDIPIVHLWSLAAFNRYHRAGVAESEG